jgi:DNA primase
VEPGCREGGDVIAFVMKLRHLTFAEAVELLANRVGVELTDRAGDRG